MRRLLFFTAIALMLFMCIPCSAATEGTGTDTSAVSDTALQGSEFTADSAIILLAIGLCILFGMIFSFYIIHNMKNKH